MTRSSSRLFVAVPLPSGGKSALSAYMNKWKRDLSFRNWVHPEDFHITLQFLGDTPEDRLPGLSDAIQEAVRTASPFRLSVEGLGLFGRPGNPSILWAGVTGELGPLQELQHKITSALSPLGYPPETRPFNPHLTVARKYTGTGTFDPALLRELAAPDTVSEDAIHWTVDEIVLYESRHKRPAPMYHVVFRYPL